MLNYDPLFYPVASIVYRLLRLLTLTSRAERHLWDASRLRNLEKMCSIFLAAVFYLGKHGIMFLR